jgi:hypothetical protein
MKRYFFYGILGLGLIAFPNIVSTMPLPTWDDQINTPDRFVVLVEFGKEAVLDRETGLVWEQAPTATIAPWANSLQLCNDKTVGNRKGWRLPTVSELSSLVDPKQPSAPMLPTGHPFRNVQSFVYWTATTSASDFELAWGVNFSSSAVNAFNKVLSSHRWCVRGGPGVNPQ